MIDVWDFGAEQLDPEKYNNMLNESIINSWYPDVWLRVLLVRFYLQHLHQEFLNGKEA